MSVVNSTICLSLFWIGLISLFSLVNHFTEKAEGLADERNQSWTHMAFPSLVLLPYLEIVFYQFHSYSPQPHSSLP